mmetsp:Transcript_9668/g.19621  ORF Transcript_9668/g.19621 Transcript_9668/m.19621 type:complete len:227 (+) Transcript_9668:391-1071(+)
MSHAPEHEDRKENGDGDAGAKLGLELGALMGDDVVQWDVLYQGKRHGPPQASEPEDELVLVRNEDRGAVDVRLVRIVKGGAVREEADGQEAAVEGATIPGLLFAGGVLVWVAFPVYAAPSCPPIPDAPRAPAAAKNVDEEAHNDEHRCAAGQHPEQGEDDEGPVVPVRGGEHEHAEVRKYDSLHECRYRLDHKMHVFPRRLAKVAHRVQVEHDARDDDPHYPRPVP